jgi:hypothetical protein
VIMRADPSIVQVILTFRQLFIIRDFGTNLFCPLLDTDPSANFSRRNSYYRGMLVTVPVF